MFSEHETCVRTFVRVPKVLLSPESIVVLALGCFGEAQRSASPIQLDVVRDVVRQLVVQLRRCRATSSGTISLPWPCPPPPRPSRLRNVQGPVSREESTGAASGSGGERRGLEDRASVVPGATI